MRLALGLRFARHCAGFMADGIESSFGSTIDDLTAFDELDEPTAGWQESLSAYIQKITERKNSSYQGREEAFAGYLQILTAKYAKNEITAKKSEIVESCLRSIKAGRTEKESLQATKALALTLVTDPDEEIYDKASQAFKRVISDHESVKLKSSLIHTLGAVAFYGGATLAETEGIMNFFMEIVESDGHSIGAGDDGGVVTAALQEWGFLCTQLEEAEEMTRESIDALVEQLDSTDVSVQVAAGENIALLYEKSYTEAEEDEVDDPHQLGKIMLQRYNPYPRTQALKERLLALTSGSKRYLSKQNKRTQKNAFRDILQSVENPLLGPQYSEITGAGRMKVKIHRNAVMRVDKWWKLHRLQHLKRLLGGGFLNHWTENPVIFESLR